MSLYSSLEAAFVIVAQPRSGSTLLVRALHSHERIKCHDEVCSGAAVHGFRTEDETAGVDDELRARLLEERTSDPEKFLFERIFSGAPGVQRGFKVVYSDLFAQTELSKFLRSFITINRIRVIHLRRLNMLRCFISVQRMSMLGIKHSDNSSPSVLGSGPINLFEVARAA